tara:strand:+ start:1370 stop:1726 length:357 start_codon:yes stop_codon:yes gene_type:complete
MKTDREILAKMAKDIKDLKKTQPNGELKRMEDSMISLIHSQQKLTVTVNQMHTRIMDPEEGIIVQTNKNTEFRIMCEPERDRLIEQFRGVLRWKRVIEWGLGVVFVGIVGALIKFLAG